MSPHLKNALGTKLLKTGRFNKKQTEVIAFDLKYKPRYNIQHGAIRTGKTVVNNWLSLFHLSDFIGQNIKFIFGSTTLGTLKNNVLDELEEMFGIDCTLNKNNEFKLFGATIKCFGLQKKDAYKRIKGFTAHGALINEATEMHKNSWDQIKKRCSGKGARIFLDTNPDQPNHYIKTDIIDKSGTYFSDGSLSINAVQWVLDDNAKENGGFLDYKYIEDIKTNTPKGHFYDRDILGLWVSADGMVYKEFSEDLIISLDDLPDISRMDLFASLDYGWEHPQVYALYGYLKSGQEDEDATYYRILEIVASRKYNDWWLDAIKEIEKKYNSGNQIQIFYDYEDKRTSSEYKKENLWMTKAKKDVLPGIRYVSTIMNQKKLKIVRENNSNYLKEIYCYIWDTNSEGLIMKQQPVKINDDSMDTERYALFTYSKKMGYDPFN